MRVILGCTLLLTLNACVGTSITSLADVTSGDPQFITDSTVVVTAADPNALSPADTDINMDFADLVNGVRLSEDIGVVTFDARLGSAAQDYADLMLAQGHFGHIGLDGSTAGDRAAAAGYDWTVLRENIAAGQIDVEAVFTAWQNSEGHRENNLAGDVEDFGLGYAGSGNNNRWVLLLGSE